MINTVNASLLVNIFLMPLFQEDWRRASE